jgi:hypothetical protein
MPVRQAFAARQRSREGRAALGERKRQFLDSLVDRSGIVNLACLGTQRRAQRRGLDRFHVRNNIDLSEPILRAFVDRERHHDALGAGM